MCCVLRTTRVDVPLGQAVCAFLSRLPKAFPTVRARSVLLLEAEEKRGTVGARRRERKVPDRYFSCQPPVSLQNMWYEKKIDPLRTAVGEKRFSIMLDLPTCGRRACKRWSALIPRLLHTVILPAWLWKPEDVKRFIYLQLPWLSLVLHVEKSGSRLVLLCSYATVDSIFFFKSEPRTRRQQFISDLSAGVCQYNNRVAHERRQPVVGRGTVAAVAGHVVRSRRGLVRKLHGSEAWCFSCASVPAKRTTAPPAHLF